MTESQNCIAQFSHHQLMLKWMILWLSRVTCRLCVEILFALCFDHCRSSKHGHGDLSHLMFVNGCKWKASGRENRFVLLQNRFINW